MKPFRFLVVFSFAILVFGFSQANAAVQDEITERQKQIEEIQRQIEKYQAEIQTSQSKARTLGNEIAKLNAQIKEIALNIRSLELSITQTSAEINLTESQIFDAETKIAKQRETLAQYLQIAYESDQETLAEIILKNDDLSDFFNDLNSLRINQENLKVSIQNIRTLKIDLEDKQNQLEDKRTEFEKLKNLEVLEKRSLDQNKNASGKLLKDTKGQESKFQDLVKRSKKDIDALRAQVAFLELNGISVEDAIKYGQLAAIRAGIRPSYLIAVLEIESGLGRNVGKCNRAEDPSEKKWQNIMHKRDHDPFLQVTSLLGLDANSTAVSCPQFVNGRRYGWGGAMGPAQFIPSTWVAYAAEVSRLTNHNPANPWLIEDAFMAAAVKLARGGATAQTRTAEIAASKAYYSGNSRCSTAPCNSYANSIQRKAEEIAKNL